MSKLFGSLTKTAGIFDYQPITTASKALLNKVIKPIAGRFATTNVEPFGYELSAVQKGTMLDRLKHFVHDVPMYPVNPITQTRELPYRKMFGLQPRNFSASGAKELASKALTLDPSTQIGKELIKETVSSAKPGGHTIFGGYSRNFNPATGDLKYYDRWDLGLNHGQKINNRSNLMRVIADKLSDPVEYKGTINAKTLPTRTLNAAQKFELPFPNQPLSFSLEYEAPTVNQKLVLSPQARLDRFESSLNRNLDHMVGASTPGLNPAQVRARNVTFDKRFRLLDEIKKAKARRDELVKQSVPFGADGKPVNIRPGPTLDEALTDTPYEKWRPYVRGVQRTGHILGQADRAIVPMTAAGLGTYGIDKMLPDDKKPVA